LVAAAGLGLAVVTLAGELQQALGKLTTAQCGRAIVIARPAWRGRELRLLALPEGDRQRGMPPTVRRRAAAARAIERASTLRHDWLDLGAAEPGALGQGASQHHSRRPFSAF